MAEGDLRWRYDAGSEIYSGIVVGSDGVIYFVKEGGGIPVDAKIIALNPDGTLKWEFTHANFSGMMSGLVLTNDESVLYISYTTELSFESIYLDSTHQLRLLLTRNSANPRNFAYYYNTLE